MELLTKYPKTTELINKWFVKKLLDSLEDPNLPEEFKKQYENTSVIDNKKLETIIKASPRALFDFFDSKNVYISIIRDYENNSFYYTLDGKVFSDRYPVRKTVEESAIIRGLKILEDL